ncbi:four-helix bundle copper-binding protein [Natribaculum luteum]|uniref:Four-helix bundle copper-binding protein n=1 Tax=Natribaculum luteum TaxID=1586232 RepID=A0ABD5NVT5_9EURY|nr:four-helix bundle copper-binding protein [Natribaculum luteum]
MALMEIPHVDERDEIERCIDDCFEAAQACEWCADECAGEGEEMARCIRLCRDVADLATMHARFMARNSNYSTQLAEACAGACEECAEECARHDHEHCQVCADVVRDCAESCRNMASA